MKWAIGIGIVVFLAWRFRRVNPVINGNPITTLGAIPFMTGMRPIMTIVQGDVGVTKFVSGGANSSAGPAINPLGIGNVAVTFDKV